MIQFMRSTSSAAASQAPLLQAGQPFYETDTHKLKIGDGSTAWNDLPYIGGSGSASSSGRNYGKVVVVGTSTAGHTADEVDFLCDGVSDHVEINTALGAVVGAGAGLVLLLNGTYTLAGTIYVNHTNVTLMGESQAVIITGTGDPGTTYGGVMIQCLRQDETSVLPRRARKIANLSIISNQRINKLDVSDCILDHVYIDGTSENGNDGRGFGIHSSNGNLECTNCYIENCFVAVELNEYSSVHDCVFVNCERALISTGPYGQATKNLYLNCLAPMYRPEENTLFAFNRCVNCGDITYQNSGNSSFMMIGNMIHGDGTQTEGLYTAGIIIGNTVSGYTTGATIGSTGMSAFIGNYVESSSSYAINIRDHVNNAIVTNNVYDSQESVDTSLAKENVVIDNNVKYTS